MNSAPFLRTKLNPSMFKRLYAAAFLVDEAVIFCFRPIPKRKVIIISKPMDGNLAGALEISFEKYIIYNTLFYIIML